MDLHDTVFQDSCFETRIHREETEDLQIGVKAIIVISITIVIFVLIYNVAYQVRSFNINITGLKVKRHQLMIN